MNKAKRQRRKQRIRARIQGTAKRPRASVFRSLAYISVQLVDDASGKTLAKAKGKVSDPGGVGSEIAKQAKKQGIKQVTFDRGGYAYHGRVKTLAESMREGGLDF